MLWLSALLEAHAGVWRVFDRALEPLEGHMPADAPVLDGRLTTFEALPEQHRDDARAHLSNVWPSALPDGLGHALRILPDAPGAWIFDGRIDSENADRDKGVAFLRRHIVLLNDTRGEGASHARMAALGAHLRQGKLFFSESVGSAKLLGRYPSGLDADEREQVRSFARMTYSMLIDADQATEQASRSWAERFWVAVPKLARP